MLAMIQAAAEASTPTLPPLDRMAIELCTSGSPVAASLLLRLLDMQPHSPIPPMQGESLIQARDERGNSLLHCAARCGSAEVTALLLSRQPALCAALNASGATAYECATSPAVRSLIRMASPKDCPVEEVVSPVPTEMEVT